ncbi:MAG: hypothetical protein IT561_11710 [Alphaproteobacteria bacterium]|nr:hypothetical protein [Alphaproteobacteria bacterium]
MGIFTAYSPQNLLSGDFWYGSPDLVEVAPFPTVINIIEPDGSTVQLFGSFVIQSDGTITDGTIESFRVIDVLGQTPFEGSGFAVDVGDEYAPRLVDGDSFGLVEATFRFDDTVLGSDGADTLVGMDGNDVVNGNGGDDDLNGNGGNDLVTGGTGQDYVRGGQGDDVVRGGQGDDWHVNGSIGSDLVYGDAGNDTVFGGQGADALFGGDGDDWLSGDLGNDTSTGGDGADAFVFRAGSGQDSIVDFAGGDRIALQANMNGTGVDTFAELVQHIAANGQGNTLIDLGGGNSLLLLGVQPAALNAGNVLFFE